MNQLQINLYDREVKKGTSQKLYVDKLYEKYRRLLSKKAWEAWKRTGLPIEDLEAHANLLFCQTYNTYDPSKGSFTTHLYWNVHYGLIRYGQKEIVEQHLNEPVPVLYTEPAFEKHNLFSCLKGEAKQIVDLLFHSPELLPEGPKKNRINKYNVVQYLKEQNWPRHKILRTFAEIRSHL